MTTLVWLTTEAGTTVAVNPLHIAKVHPAGKDGSRVVMAPELPELWVKGDFVEICERIDDCMNDKGRN